MKLVQLSGILHKKVLVKTGLKRYFSYCWRRRCANGLVGVGAVKYEQTVICGGHFWQQEVNIT